MKGFITVTFPLLTNIQNLQTQFENQIRTIKASFLTKSKTKDSICIYEIGFESSVQEQMIQKIICQMRKKNDISITSEKSEFQIDLNEKQLKFLSQESKTLHEQHSNFSNSEAALKLDRKSDEAQFCQDISVSSDEFELLNTQKEHIEPLESMNEDRVIEQIEYKQKQSQQTFQQLRTQTDKQPLKYQEELLQKNAQPKKSFVTSNVQKSVNAKQTDIHQNKYQGYDSLNKSSTSSKQVGQGNNQEKMPDCQQTSEQLLKYFTGKDDYTKVFKLNKEQRQSQQIQIHQEEDLHKVTSEGNTKQIQKDNQQRSHNDHTQLSGCQIITENMLINEELADNLHKKSIIHYPENTQSLPLNQNKQTKQRNEHFAQSLKMQVSRIETSDARSKQGQKYNIFCQKSQFQKNSSKQQISASCEININMAFQHSHQQLKVEQQASEKPRQITHSQIITKSETVEVDVSSQDEKKRRSNLILDTHADQKKVLQINSNQVERALLNGERNIQRLQSKKQSVWDIVSNPTIAVFGSFLFITLAVFVLRQIS